MKDTLVQGQSLLMIKKVWPLFFLCFDLGDHKVVCTLFVIEYIRESNKEVHIPI